MSNKINEYIRSKRIDFPQPPYRLFLIVSNYSFIKYLVYCKEQKALFFS